MTIQHLVPNARVYAPAQRFIEAVAPPLAARQQSTSVWSAEQIYASRPNADTLVIETFGSPFSPLNDFELQIDLIRRFAAPTVLVSSSKLGAVGRTLQTCEALACRGVPPSLVVLLGPVDRYAETTLRQHLRDVPVWSLRPPSRWAPDGIAHGAKRERQTLEALRTAARAFPRRSTAAESLKDNPGPTITVPRLPQDMLDRDRCTVWHPYTSLHDPVVAVPCIGAQDEFLHLADGRRVIDGVSSWWTILHGHRHPVLMQALADASKQIDHVLFAGATHPWAVQLAELLLQSMPWSGGRVFYSDNGSTAVEVALKMAYQYWSHQNQPARTRFVGFQNGYHGDTFGAMAVSRDPVFFGRFEPLLFKADVLTLDPQALDEHLRRHAHETAAVIIEPLVQGAGGMRMHTPETLGQIFEVTKQHNVLFIADEVMTGGGRTGTLWAFQQAKIAPDLVCAAKTLAGGVLPLAATMASPRIVAAFETDDRSRTFFHGHSFTAHPLACAVAAANWTQLMPQAPDQARRHGLFWAEGLSNLNRFKKTKDVRICGSIAAIEFDLPGGYLAEVGQRLRQVSLDCGVLLRPLGNVLYAMPPYCTSNDSLFRIADAMITALQVVWKT